MNDTTTFRALWIELDDDGNATRRIVDRQVADLPQGDVLVEVVYSSLNPAGPSPAAAWPPLLNCTPTSTP